MSAPRYLVTGSMGCLGAWVLHHLVKEGKEAVSFDLSEDRSRLNLLLTSGEQQAVTFVRGDLTDFTALLELLRERGVTHIIHLAALQIPFCKADPALGARVNVVGNVNVFEAAKQAGITHLTFASSLAVYGPAHLYDTDERGVVLDGAPLVPQTHYGVYKQANEGTARVYWQDASVSSVALRPYTVYGVGRDQGLTSEPTKAMLAAAAGKDYHIGFGGRMQFHYASDVARQFIEAAETPVNGALGFNLGTDIVSVADVARLIEEAQPGIRITYADTALPFPEGLDAGALKQHLPQTAETPLREGVCTTISHFRSCLQDKRLQVPA